MKILLDECLPRPLKRELPGHEGFTVPEMGWAGVQNGALLTLMEPLFDVFVTIDGKKLAMKKCFSNPHAHPGL